VSLRPGADTLGLRGLAPAAVHLDGARIAAGAILGEAPDVLARADIVARLALAATAVGVAQAAFEAALRYSQQRSAFGKPIALHQAVQLKLADMATSITAARLLVYDAAAAEGDVAASLAKILATETAATVTLEAMRIHGGYGYTTEFPVERFYRDAAHLPAALGGNDAERAALAAELLA
jgi:alkylation response protein AidB-like acyl-CoA dehydrogenase